MILTFDNITPEIHKDAYISNSVDIIGNVKVGKNTNIWFGTRLRGDMNKIIIGENTNIQENTVVHVDVNSETIIGNDVTIGHGAIIHGCKINDNVLVGMGAIILNDAEIGKNTIIAAGSLVPQGKKIPEGVLCMGSPAKVVRELSKEEIDKIKRSAITYVELSNKYK